MTKKLQLEIAELEEKVEKAETVYLELKEQLDYLEELAGEKNVKAR